MSLAPRTNGIAGPLIVTGFHRSGTSMLAQTLAAAGLDLGDSLIPADFSNPDGHYEDVRVKDLHERALLARGLNWRTTADGPVAVDQPLEEEFRRYVLQRAAAGCAWGFKDPRACLFLPSWRRISPGCRLVAIYRHYWECTESLLARHSRAVAYDNKITPHIEFWLDPSLAPRMWLGHNRALVAYARAHRDACLVVSHAALMSGFPVVRETQERFGMRLGAAPSEIVKEAYATARQVQAFELPAALLGELESVWNDLQALAERASATMRPSGHRPWFGSDDVTASGACLEAACLKQANGGPPDAAPGRTAAAGAGRDRDARRILEQANALERRGEPLAAEHAIARGLEAMPENWLLLRKHAQILARTGETRRALARREQASRFRFAHKDQSRRLLTAASKVPDPRARVDLIERMTLHVQDLAAARY